MKSATQMKLRTGTVHGRFYTVAYSITGILHGHIFIHVHHVLIMLVFIAHRVEY